MSDITVAHLRAIAPGANQQIIEGLVPYLNLYLPQYEINTLLRVAHFLGQTAEESASYRTLKEYASGSEYEGRTDLGNTQAGDGVKYKGRGMLQLTGRANYTTMSQILGIDLVNHPELAETPEVAVQTACEYWKTHKLNVYADADDINTITRRINGGTNGLQMRVDFVNKAKQVLDGVFGDTPDPVSNGIDMHVTGHVVPAPVDVPVTTPVAGAAPANTGSNGFFSFILKWF